ncbi:MAG: dTDP-4-dehydrorhamnose reductase [Proteobacteria bacterium]|nr:dTDP-4-dehydrorhamnose reductase [Pseudomonadota bacterium]
MRIFVTGGDGQLGRAMAEVGKDGELYPGRHDADDITRPEIIQTICDFKPDVVVHAAAMTDVDACELKPDQAFLVNEQGTRHVAQAARRAGALMVYISTDYVFDGNKESPYLETDPVKPINVYGQSKLAGERATREAADRWLIVRTSWVYGKGRKNFVTNVLEWAKTQPVLRLVKDKVGSPTYAKDLALAIKHLAQISATGIYHVSGEGACTWVEYGQEILKIAGIEKEIVPIPFEELKRPAKRPSYSVLSNRKLGTSGFVMRSWEAAVQDFLMNRDVLERKGPL